VGLLESGPDPLDRRRTLVRTTPVLNTVEQHLSRLSIDEVLAKELAAEDQEELTSVIAALDLLSRLLIPEAYDPVNEPPESQASDRTKETTGV
jgi:DNA-binding MarR family transcriptional regulator